MVATAVCTCASQPTHARNRTPCGRAPVGRLGHSLMPHVASFCEMQATGPAHPPATPGRSAGGGVKRQNLPGARRSFFQSTEKVSLLNPKLQIWPKKYEKSTPKIEKKTVRHRDFLAKIPRDYLVSFSALNSKIQPCWSTIFI